MHIRPVRERDLGRIQMVGSLTIVFLILVIIGNYVILAQYEAHEKQLHAQKEQLIGHALAGLEQEGEHLYEYIDYYRRLTHKRLKESVKERAVQAFTIAQKISRTHQDASDQSRIKEVLSQLQWRNGYSYVWIVDKAGRAVLFGSNPALEGQKILDIVDARGKQVVRAILEVALQKGEGYVEDIAMQIDTNRSVEQIAYVKYLPALEWVIGTGETIDDIEMATQEELLERIRQMQPNRASIGIIDAEKNLLVGEKAPKPAQIDRALTRTIRYRTDSGEELLFARNVPQWDWTLFITLPLAEIETHIDALETRVNADLDQSLIILGTLFTGVSVLSVFLSFLLSRRLRLAFRRHRSTSLEQRKSMRRLYRKLSREQQRTNEALETKNRFLSNLSHELHTPLTALMGHANLLMQRLDAPHRQHAQVIVEASEQLLALQNDLIACANAEKIPVVQNYFDIAKMARHLYGVFDLEAQKHRCEWSIQGAQAPLMITNDQAKTYRMLLALLGCAFHAAAHGSLTLCLHQKREKVRLLILDSSPLSDSRSDTTDAFAKAHQTLGAGSLQSSWAVVHSHAALLHLPLHQRLHKRLGRCYWLNFPCSRPQRLESGGVDVRLEEDERRSLLDALDNGRLASMQELAKKIRDTTTRETLQGYLDEGDILTLEKRLTLYDSRHPGHS